MYSDVFCKVYNAFGWNYYPEIFGQQLLQWLQENRVTPKNAMDLACGTGILCKILHEQGILTSGMDFSAGMIDIARENDPDSCYTVADMITFRPETQFDLVTCTGDAINHIEDLADVETIFQNVYAYTAKGGYFIFDLLSEQEISTSEPFSMDFSDTVKVWFQMTRPAQDRVNLCIRVYENDALTLEENIRETVHDPAAVCASLQCAGFTLIQCSHQLSSQAEGTAATWFVIARKE